MWSKNQSGGITMQIALLLVAIACALLAVYSTYREYRAGKKTKKRFIAVLILGLLEIIAMGVVLFLFL
jgi:ABC-type amino acid transport system permease subunit